ncbi:beta-N-acetylhexosaminidase [Tessaracoccus terricola]
MSPTTPQLVPQPRSLRTTGDGNLTIPRQLPVSAPVGWADTVAELLAPGTGIRTIDATGDAFLKVTRAAGEPSGYRLVTGPDGISIEAFDDDGLVHALATLRQLMPDHVFGPSPLPDAALTVPQVEIEDAPRFEWRGMHLDVCRHFMPLPFLHRFVDLLAMHKFNRFHLHLNDDQGWRFEVRKYPELTTVGAVRPGTQFHHWDTDDGTPVGGFYTQDQLRALNAYAKRRGVTIVPEIDFPGHARALLAAYPQFGEDPPAELATTFAVFPEVLHLSDETVAMVEDVFSELLDVFDSPWIHIGGDECPTTQWENSDAAAALAAERGLDGVKDLQPWFTEHLRDWLSSRGRTVIGWDEIIDRGPMPGVVVMSWRGGEPGRRALATGHRVIMSSNVPYYFDYYQSEDMAEPFAQPEICTWEAVTAFDPADGVAEEHLPNLLGVQGQLWTEFMRTPAHVEYMAFPRAAALAEVGWHGPLDPADFEPRLRTHLRRLDAAGVNHRPLEGPHPWQTGGTGAYARPAGHGLGGGFSEQVPD